MFQSSLPPSIEASLVEFEKHLKAGSSGFSSSQSQYLVASDAPGRAMECRRAVEFVYTRLGQILDENVPLVIPWNPPTDDLRIAQHFTDLDIPTVDFKPSLLLHRLGEDSSGFDFNLDPKSRQRNLDAVFIPWNGNSGTKHSVLFNTSGAGKTRLVFEGLCREWGFYFTCKREVTECGSADLQYVLQTPRGYLEACGTFKNPSSIKECKTNSEHATRCFNAVLTSRALVLYCLLTAYEARYGTRYDNQHLSTLKKAWLFIQLDTRLLERPEHPDLFLELSTLFCHVEASDTLDNLSDAMLGLSKRILNRYKPNTQIYCVIDESQTAALSFPDAFRNATGCKPRPALREMLKVWSTLGMRHITTGTSLDLAHIIDALSSTVGKPAEMENHAINGTGSFVNSEEQIDGYLHSYLPSWYILSRAGQELLRRARYWLLGRYVLLLNIFHTI
ncbi:hypothetical protein H0H87_004420 [Tephrocybe sp. NHM501043]|nr:hypothetical protein H0H87_004420 [Tephrocybe sp. NHM501043]